MFPCSCRIARRCWLLVVCVLLAVLVLPAMPGTAQQTLPWRDKSSPFGVVATLGNRVRADEVGTAVGLMREAGVQWQREEIFWDRVQKTPDGPFTWDGDGSGFYNYDQAIGAQVAAGINVLGLLDYNPYWFKSRNPPPDAWLEDWGEFVYAAVARYGRDRGWITHWELWNEPNVREAGYESGLYEIQDFVRILEVGRAAALAADPNAKIVMGGMAGLTEISAPFDYDPLDYLDEVGRLGGWNHVDIIALHPYHPAPPEGTIRRFDREVTLRGELQHMDELLRRYGAKPVWLTELGWTTSQGFPGVSEDEQALYLLRAYMLALAHPSVEKVFWYDFRNDTHPDAAYTNPIYNSREFEFHYGLLRRSYPLNPERTDLRKPAFVAFRTMTHMLGGLHLYDIAADGNTPDAPGVYWYRFGGPRQVDVLWRTGDAQPTLTVPCGCREAVVRTWSGQVQQVVYAVDGTLTVRPGAVGAPLYIAYDPPVAQDGHIFAETGHSIRGAFRTYWEGRGGLARFGYPITEELVEPEIGSGRVRVVQYFERARFEHYPEYSATPREVQSTSLSLGRLGLERAAIYPAAHALQGEAAPGCRVFTAPGYRHRVELCPPFLGMWQRYEEVAPLGVPLTNAFTMQAHPATGAPRRVQYFEHARLEYFPEHAGTPFEVQFGLLGREVFTQVGGMR